MTPGCTIIGTVVAKPDTREELQAILAAQVDPTRAEEGCINYDFHVDASDPCVFVFYENWTSTEHLQAHLASSHIAEYIAATEGSVDQFTLNEMTQFA